MTTLTLTFGVISDSVPKWFFVVFFPLLIVMLKPILVLFCFFTFYFSLTFWCVHLTSYSYIDGS